MTFPSIILVALAIINLSAAGLLGGRKNVRENDQFYGTAVQHARAAMTQDSNDVVDFDVISAQYQIIAGIKYYLRLGVTVNGVNQGECNLEVLRLVSGGGTWSVNSRNPEESCFRLVNRPTMYSATHNRNRRSPHLLGGREELDLTEQGVWEAANWAVDHINGRSNSMYRQALQKISEGSRQVVNGYKYKLLLFLVSTSCRNNRDNFGKGLEECPASDSSKPQQCDVTVLHSNGEYSMLDFRCKALKVEKVLGGDDHDYKPHGNQKPMLGGDDHDYKPHGNQKPMLGGDDHDYKPHGNQKPMLGGDDHDYKPHGNQKPMLGGDDHDYKPHGNQKPMLGGDDHDYKPHGNQKPMLGGDDHDYKPHGNQKPMLGGDDHDYKPHGNQKPMLGGDDHDYKPHGNQKPMLGGDDHDYKPHGNQKPMLGGDDHDYKPHGNILGQDWQDLIPNLKSNLHGLMSNAGKDAKDKLLQVGKEVLKRTDALRKLNVLGGDTHDYQPHGNDPCQEYRADFEEFKSKHQRLYASEKEESEKFQIFCGNMERVKEYQKMERGSAVYGATQFADISESEFKEKYLGWKMSGNGVRSWPSAEIPEGPVPASFDWRDHNAVTPVKNQGSCGSCWAFSATGNIEGRNAIKHKKLVSLSEQELLDCDKVDQSCNGGLPTQAYEAIMELGGIETEQDYEYEGAKETCHFKKSEIAVKLTGAVNISKDEGEMAAWLAKNGPISIGINAFAMQFYFGGIAHPWKIFCSPSSLDHGVLIVGYGMEGNEPYWIVKNSWGAGWGRQGYYYVYRGDGTCGLNTMCTSAIVE